MAQQISLDKETFKALAGETRVQILKELLERQKTQSELASKLHLSAPTVNEHLLLLKRAGLVQEIDDGHKWKYFSLSSKGKNILRPGEAQIMLVLSVLAVAFVGLLAMILMQTSGIGNFSSAQHTEKTIEPAPLQSISTGQANSTDSIAERSHAAAQALIPEGALLEIGLLAITTGLIGLVAGYKLKKQ